tara:strand:- start:492 stop:608 length:117 start_codon:yes stop_codon:yes gene_type:complete
VAVAALVRLAVWAKAVLAYKTIIEQAPTFTTLVVVVDR